MIPPRETVMTTMARAERRRVITQNKVESEIFMMIQQ